MEVVDASQYLGDLSGESRTSSDLQPRRSPDHLTGEDGPEWELVDVVLTGGAPWGFSLRGGLEHQEPLLITKVEEGSRAASAHLQVEDEIVSINGVPLSGYRKEAICLVKSSSKSLTLEIKRRNEPSCRPESWHSAKVSENTLELPHTEATPVLGPAGQTACDAGSPSDDFKSCLVQTDLQHASCQFSSVANIERTKQSTNKAQSGAGHSVAGRSVHKHKSAFNSFSCGTADQSNSPSSEYMFYQGSLSESHRNSQVPVSNGGGASARLEEQTGSRCSSSGRMNLNPVWYIPDKSSAASSPSPPTPSRSDNFTAAQVYEKGSAVPYSQGPPSCSSQKTHSRVTDRRFDDYHVSESGPESRRAYDTLSRKDFLHIHLPAEDYNPNRLKTKKSLSSSTTDVRQLQNPFTCHPQHQRQHSDEVSFYLQPMNACAPKTQIVGSYYSTLQSLPSNAGVHYQARSFTASQASAGQEHNPDELAHLRYCCITAQQPTLLISQAKVVEEPRPESDTSKDGSGQKPEKSQRAIKYKYPPPYIQASEINSGNEHFKQTVILCPAEGTSPGPSPAMVKSNSNETEKENPWRKDRGIDENQHSKNILYQQTEQRNLPTIAHGDTLRNPCISRDQHKICPEKTPLLHFLAQESHILANSTMASTNEVTQQETSDPSSGKQGRRSDRYATSLRNEVQEKRAQLQKSRSVASLSCIGESEDADVWKSTETSTSSSDGSFTNTYKDHLKEAQARVLQATSFKRRDLEIPRSESSIKMGSTNSQVPRIGSRKRFPMDKRVHSFSEPEKINEVGVKVKTSHHMAGGSFEDKCKFFEGASRLAFSRPVLKKFPLSITEDISRGKYKLMSFVGEKNRKSKESHGSRGITAGEEKQRLGTFAEYEATWNLQRKLTDGKISSRYRSAENILDADLEERISLVCIHERSKSSPSTDYQEDKINTPAQKSGEESHPKCKRDQEIYIGSTSNRRHSDVNIFEPLELNTVRDLEHRNITAHLLSVHTTRVAILPPRYPHHHCLQGPVFEQLLPSENNGPAPQKPAQPREYSSTRPEATCPSNPLKALPNQAHSQNKDSHSLRAPGNGCRSETEHDLSAVLPQVTPQFSSPHWSAEVSIPSAYASSSSSPRDDLQRNMVENKSQPSSVVKKAQICDVQAKSRHYLVHGELPGGPDETSVHQVSLPCSPRQSHLLSCASPHQSPQNGSNSSSSDAQTPVGTPADNAEMMKTSSVPPELSEEDEKRDELARDIMVRDKRLVDILDQRKMKTTMDMMEGIYPDGKHLLEGAQQRRKTSTKQTVRTTQERRVDNRIATPVSLVTSSSYYSTSAPKAELLIKMKDMQEQMKEQDCEDELDLSKKKELMDSLARKLQVLREARESLQEDMRDNDALGEEVEATVRAVCKPNELDKFCMFVGDLDKVVSLLLSLSGRLARVENALNNLEEGASAEEKHTLTEKRKLLIRQHEDAKELKENLDRRERLVHTILAGYLSKEHLADYQHFVKMKAALIIEQRMLEDRIKLGDEQLKCLKDSLPLDQRLHL
ncbi:protein Shroom2 isoform X2 [Electrophorus electricus]|uniref:protein Shroom2 isoform X2 n=1 Tax=Electrophorus electricus TaxID=8005 RepID=UPI0015CFED90|nr:protein Shroom2 isoform X2 [Electrophorus electricus]